MQNHPLITHKSQDSIIAWRDGVAISVAKFLVDVHYLATLLPAGKHILNVCRDRYHFTVGLAAAIISNKISVLPPTHTAEMMRQLQIFAPDVFCLHDNPDCNIALPLMIYPNAHENTHKHSTHHSAEKLSVPQINAQQLIAIVFTSGSTGAPIPHQKSWGGLVNNVQAQAARLGLSADTDYSMIGTIPPQHMYGFESTILLPMQTGNALSCAQPFYPADITDALTATPAPRVLVSTPLHLRLLLDAELNTPELALTLSATAPLSSALAHKIEAQLQTPLLEIYGSTETGQINQATYQSGTDLESGTDSKSITFTAKLAVSHQRRTIWAASMLAVAIVGNSQSAHAALVSPCSGVSLPKSVVTDIVGQAVLPLTGLLDSIPLLGILGLNTNLTNTLTGIANGGPINLNVLDTSGNLVSPADQCQATADGFNLNTPKGISIGGNSITGLGNGTAASAGELNSIAFGNGSVTDAAAINSMAIGPSAFIGALGTNSVALGRGANSNVANSVALGAGSTAGLGAQTNYSAFGLSAPQNSVGEVSFGSASNARKLTNVAAGSADTDVVNVSQLRAVDDGAIKYNVGTPRLKMTATLGGATSTDGGTTNGTLITNLSKGAISATSTDAVNGSQLFAISNGVAANMDALGLSMATNLGGGAAYNSSTGAVSAPTYNVYGAPQTNAGSAITALQASAPLQYSNAAGVATPNTPSNHVTLVGATTGPVALHNVANGVAATDAVNKSQLDAVQSNVANLDALNVKYDNSTKDKITFSNTISADGGITGGTTLANLNQGEVSEFSTEAINGAQLFATNQLITNVSNGGGIKYFHAKSTLADSIATGNDSVAAGSRAIASGNGSVAMGDNSQATQTGAIAIGQNAAATGVNSIAIGAGALATGSVAVGVNAQAGNGGAAFGDNAIALTPQQGTALGNAANVTANRGVALGASAQATRAGMNGATEKYSNVAVTSTEGAVSVGSAGNERQITNVAGGTADTDAVNVRQLDAAIAQSSMDINNRLGSLQSEISSVRSNANAGTASAMAMASMPQSVIPGKAMMAAGVANYQGQSALSVGISNFSENGRWAINFNGSANTRGKAGAAVGVGIHW